METLVQFILIIVQRHATQSSLFIILQVHSTCFGCQPHPLSGAHKTVTAASDTDHIYYAGTSFQAKLHSTGFGCQPHPSSGAHKTVTTASRTDHIFCAAASLQHGQLDHVGGR